MLMEIKQKIWILLALESKPWLCRSSCLNADVKCCQRNTLYVGSVGTRSQNLGEYQNILWGICSSRRDISKLQHK